MPHKAYIVVDLGFGDSGKGTVTDALVRANDASLVVRYCGGAQAAHSVVDADGRSHTFSQFGSGTLVPDVKTFLSRYTLFDPPALYFENLKLEKIGVTDAMQRLHVDKRAKVVTPYHVNSNRINEYIRGTSRHGSCGRGIGETVRYSIDYPKQTLTVGDLLDKDVLWRKMTFFRERIQTDLYAQVATIRLADTAPDHIRKEVERLYDPEEFDAAVEEFHRIATLFHVEGEDFLTEHFSKDGVTVFEGAQGILLDQDWGFPPHNTWTTTTSENAITLIDETDVEMETVNVGVMRAYTSRHGAGPFPTEDSRMESHWRDTRNPENNWQGAFRYGWLDLNLVQYALEVNGGVQELAITCLDHMANMPEELPWKVAQGYEIHGNKWQLHHDENRKHSEQRALGKMLGKATPVYNTMAPRNVEEYAQFVSILLRTPVTILSNGPKSSDKTFIQGTKFAKRKKVQGKRFTRSEPEDRDAHPHRVE